MIEISPHALDRFVERIVPDHTYRDARILFANRANKAAPIKKRTVNGQELWKMTEPDALLVVKRDQHPVVVTVLPPEEEVDMSELLRLEMEQNDHHAETEIKVKRSSYKLVNALSSLRDRTHAGEEKIKAGQQQIQQGQESFQSTVKKILDDCDEDVLRLLRLKELIPSEYDDKEE